jgi:DNA invertase Pin-like site-specific DNA recombinase
VRQADSDLSIPDQRRQAKAYCASRGWEIVAEYVEPGASATDDRRPQFQRMIDAATTKPPPFDVILVHSFSRFFRDQFQLEFYVRRLAKDGVRLVSITQELGDDPMSNMIPDHGAIRRVSIQGERQTHAASDEGERAPGLLEWRIAADRLPCRGSQ